jgi:hypothetical protein
VRELIDMQDAKRLGLTRSALRAAERRGDYRKGDLGVWAEGPEPLLPLDRARAALKSTGAVATDVAAGRLRGLDGLDGVPMHISLGRTGNGRRPGARRPSIGPEDVSEVHGVLCAGLPDTMIRLSKYLDDLRWELALESALRLGMPLEEFLAVLDGRPTARTLSRRRIDRVLALRPPGAAPTGSYLETKMVQLCRTVPGLPPPIRHYEVYNRHGIFVAQVDLAWDDLGMFTELDGQQHKDEPVYDARREAAVVAATGWLVVRKTYYEVIYVPRATARQVGDIADQARRRRFID